jgi:hypothetical protein
LFPPNEKCVDSLTLDIFVGDKTASCEELRLVEIPTPGLIAGDVIIGGGDLVVVLVVFSRLNCTV